jgi:hypothetical protein
VRIKEDRCMRENKPPGEAGSIVGHHECPVGGESGFSLL